MTRQTNFITSKFPNILIRCHHFSVLPTIIMRIFKSDGIQQSRLWLVRVENWTADRQKPRWTWWTATIVYCCPVTVVRSKWLSRHHFRRLYRRYRRRKASVLEHLACRGRGLRKGRSWNREFCDSGEGLNWFQILSNLHHPHDRQLLHHRRPIVLV